ncbi:hypothetical protein AABM38_10635 [Heyndrickxia sp. MSNUG]|uniref:hypothetical protein n=1 Tax=Heyndrickxia sp. MSNUG TaxID=3136677 RepID=UPI003C2C400A
MITRKLVLVYLIIGILLGCTSKNDIDILKQVMSSVTSQLILSQEKAKDLEAKNAELTLAMEEFTDPRNYERNIEMQAVALKLKAKSFSSNYETGEGLPLLHSLIFAEHISPYFSYVKEATIKKSDPKISKYFEIPDGLIKNYFLYIKFTKSIEVPIYVIGEPNKIVSDEVLLIIDKEKELPILYIKIDTDLYNSYQVDTRGMRTYQPAIWINPLVEHMQLLKTE